MQTLNNITVTADTSQAVNAVQVLNNTWTEMNSAVNLAGLAIQKAAGAVQKFMEVGRRIEEVNRAAAAMSRYGLGKGMLQALRADTADVVDQLTLAQNAARLMSSGAVQSLREVSEAYQWALQKAAQYGKTPEEAIQSITDALIGGRADALKNFGVQIELTGEKAEKSAKLIQYMQKEMRFSDGEFEASASNYIERVQQLKNAMLDTIEGFSAISKGYSLVGASIDYVTKKLKKDVGEVWSDILKAGTIGAQKLQNDVSKIISALNEAKTEGDQASVEFLTQKLEKVLGEGQAFLGQFEELYGQFGEAAGAEAPTALKQNIEQTLNIARTAARDTAADIDAALDKLQEMDAQAIAAAKNRAKEKDVELRGLTRHLELVGRQLAEDIRRGESAEIIAKRLELEANIRADIQKVLSKTVEGSNMIYLMEQGTEELLRKKDALLAGQFKKLLKSLDAEKKAVEERRKYGRLLENGVNVEKNLGALKKEYIAVLDGQLQIAKRLNDQARMKFLIEAKDKAEAIKTLAELEAELKKMEVEREKKQTEARRDEEKKQLKFLKLRLQLAREAEYPADIIIDLQNQVAELEKIVQVEGAAREKIMERTRAERENLQAVQKNEQERQKQREAQAAEERREFEEANKIADERLKRVKFYALEQIKLVEELRKRYAALQDSQLQGGPEGVKILRQLERIGAAARRLEMDMQGLAQPLQEQQKAYNELLRQYAEALADGDKKLAESLRFRLMAIRAEATEITQIRQAEQEAEQRLVYAQFANEEIRSEIARKELELKAALRDKSLERAAALQREIAALQGLAEENGRAAKSLEGVLEKYRTLGEVGTVATNALSQAVWADKAALEQYHGSRLKMMQAIFADSMKKKAVEETVAALSMTGQALAASFFAPAAAPALWASAASHAAAALATGFASRTLAVSRGKPGGGGGAESSGAAQKSGFGDTAKMEQKQEVVINVNLAARDGWVGNVVDAIIEEQRRGKARRGVL